ncbi:MAG TPA: hypothetical protein H9829_05065 [Candidatus Tetragenococcus pullicola]|nr:hypothetical protein [Candidatus Tetragenococcus pullicola]
MKNNAAFLNYKQQKTRKKSAKMISFWFFMNKDCLYPIVVRRYSRKSTDPN